VLEHELEELDSLKNSMPNSPTSSLCSEVIRCTAPSGSRSVKSGFVGGSSTTVGFPPAIVKRALPLASSSPTSAPSWSGFVALRATSAVSKNLFSAS
jgi:hypothetical protein